MTFLNIVNNNSGRGQDNTFSGFQCGNNTLNIGSAVGNTAMGVNAALSLDTGDSNVMIGAHAGSFITDGANNVCVGYGALAGTGAILADFCVAIGSGALDNNGFTGFSCTAIGFEAARKLSGNAQNVIAIGLRAGDNWAVSGAETNVIAIGSNAIASQNDSIFLGTEGVHAKTYIAGILAAGATGSPLMVTVDTVSGQLGSQSVPSGGTLTPVTVSGATQTIAANTSYYVNSGVLTTFTLPASGVVGSIFRITLVNGSSSSFTIHQNAGQQICVADGASTAGTGGSVSSIGTGGSVTFECIQAASDIFSSISQTLALDVV